MKLKDNRGFTLIELIVSLAILLIISVPLSQLIVQGSINNMHTRHLEQATQLGQSLLEEVLQRVTIAVSPVTPATTPRITAPAPYDEFSYTLEITERSRINNGVNDTISASAAEPSVPVVEVIDGNTGQRRQFDLRVDTSTPIPDSLDTARPVASAIEDYSFPQGSVLLKNSTLIPAPPLDPVNGMDVIYHLKTGGITKDDVSGVGTVETQADTINISLAPDVPGNPREIIVARGLVTDSIFVDRISGRARVAFIVETDERARNLRLASKIPESDLFGIDVFIIRGIKTNSPLVFFGGNVEPAGTTKALNFTYTPGSSATQTPESHASKQFKVHEGLYMPAGSQSSIQMLYDVTVRVYRRTDPMGSNPIATLKTTAKRGPN